jgi:hypothetical protein
VRRTSRAKSSRGFVRSDNFTLLALAAQKFGSRPSELAGLRDPVLALDFDLAAAARLLETERAAIEDAASGGDDIAGRDRDLDW